MTPTKAFFVASSVRPVQPTRSKPPPLNHGLAVNKCSSVSKWRVAGRPSAGASRSDAVRRFRGLPGWRDPTKNAFVGGARRPRPNDMSTTQPTEPAIEQTIGELRIATDADGQYVEVRTCPFCGLKFRNFGVRFADHWPNCVANNLEPLGAVASMEGER